jgi:drug/metabolite transporter superfamily protein YnfA
MKAHRTDSLSLFFGLAFLLIAGGYLAGSYLNLDLPGMGWFVAAGLIVLGVVGAITALTPSRRQIEEKQDTDAEQPL